MKGTDKIVEEILISLKIDDSELSKEGKRADKIRELVTRLKSQLDVVSKTRKETKQYDLELRKIDKTIKHLNQNLDAKKRKMNDVKTSYDSATKSVEKYRKEIEKTEKIETKKSKMSTAIGNVGRYMTAGFVMSPYAMMLSGIAGYMKETFVGAMNLNKELYKLKATTNATSSDMKAMTTAIKSMSSEFGYTSKEATELALNLGRMGVSAKDIAKVTMSVGALAKVTGADLAKAGEVVIQTMNGFGVSFDNVEYATNLMTKTINESALTLEKYATIMGYVSAAAYETGTSMEEASAMVMVLANNGLKASTIGTSIRNILGKLAGEGDNMIDILKKLQGQTISYGDAVKIVGQRSANALTILTDKLEDVIKLQNKAEASMISLAEKANIVKTSPIQQLRTAGTSMQTIIQMMAQGDITGKDPDLKNVLRSKLDASQTVTYGLGGAQIHSTYNREEARQAAMIWLDEDVKAAFAAKGSEMNTMSVSDKRKLLEDTIKPQLENDAKLKEALSNYAEETVDSIAERLSASMESTFIEATKSRLETNVAKQMREASKTGKYSSKEYQEMSDSEFNAAMIKEAEDIGKIQQELLGLSGEKIDYGKIPTQAGVTKYGTSEALKRRIIELQNEVKKVQSKSVKTKVDYGDIAEKNQLIDEMLKEYCSGDPDSPLCRNVKGFKKGNEIPSLRELYIQMNKYDTQRQMKTIEANIATQQAVYRESINKIKSAYGTSEYNVEKSNVVGKYNDAISAIFRAAYGTDSPENIKSMADKEVDNLNSLLSRLEELTKERVSSVKSKYGSDTSSVDYKNDMDMVLADNERVKDQILERIERVRKSSSSFETGVMGSAYKPTVEKVSYEKSMTEAEKTLAALYEKMADEEAEILAALTSGKIGIEQAQQKLMSGNPITRAKGSIELEGANKRMYKSQIDAAKRRAEYFEELEIAASKAIESLKQEESDTRSKYESDISFISGASSEEDFSLMNLMFGSRDKDVAMGNVSSMFSKKMDSIARSKKRYSSEMKSHNKNKESNIAAGNEADPNGFGLDDIKMIAGVSVDAMNSGLEIYQSIQDKMLEATLNRIKKEQEAEKKKYDTENSLLNGALELGLLSQGEYAEKKADIEESYQNTMNELQKEAFEKEKEQELKMAKIKFTQRLAEIALNALVAESKKGVVGIATSAVAIAAFTAAAVAQHAIEVKAISQKEYVPQTFEKGGYITGKRHRDGGVPFSVAGNIGFEAEGGEYIINRNSTSRYRKELDEINNGTFDRNSYYTNSGEVVVLLEQILDATKIPTRAIVSSDDLKNDERRRRILSNKVKI